MCSSPKVNLNFILSSSNMPNNVQKKCPQGYFLRKSYVRKQPNENYTVRRKGKLYTAHPGSDNVYVPSGCVKRPIRNKTSKIGKLRKGALLKYGYQYRISDRLRHIALEKAIDKYGLISVYHKLDAVAKLTERTAPDASTIFVKDRDWIRSKIKANKKT